jgi:hypothetical protein
MIGNAIKVQLRCDRKILRRSRLPSTFTRGAMPVMEDLPPESQYREPPFERLEYRHRWPFGGGLHVQIVRRRDSTYELTELPAPGIRAESVNRPRLVSDESIRVLASALAVIRISIVPPNMSGLDGGTSTLTIEAGFNKVVIHWWAEPVNEWAALDVAVRKICNATGCQPRRVLLEDHMQEMKEQRVIMAAEEQAREEERKKDFARRREAVRAKAISLGLATPENVNEVLCEMSRDEFGRHFSEFRVSRIHFKD